MTTRPLMAVAKAKAALDRAEANYVAAVVQARNDGASLRAIATAAGTNHESVRQALRRAEQ